jgi:hypothetical protein
MTPRPKREPRLDLIEVCWRVVGPSANVIECGIYRTDVGLEVRAGYSLDNLLRSEFTTDIEFARHVATIWKEAAIEKGFTEIPGKLSAPHDS